MKTLDNVTGGLLILAGLNCGLVAVFQRDLVAEIAPMEVLPRLLFALVGAAALYRLLVVLTQPTRCALGSTQA